MLQDVPYIVLFLVDYFYPFILCRSGSYNRLDKPHATDTVFGGREIQGFRSRFLTSQNRSQSQGEIPIQISECLYIAFRMPARRTGIMSGDTRHISIGSTDDLRRTIRPTHNHRIRFFLTPFQPTFLSIHTNIQAILYTYGDLIAVSTPFAPPS